MKIFGFTIGGTRKVTQTFATPTADDGSIILTSSAGSLGSTVGAFVDIDSIVRSEAELVTNYRELSLRPECDSAITDIVNEAVVTDHTKPTVSLDSSDTDMSDSERQILEKEFKHVLRLLDFDSQGPEIFRRWYVDGKIYYHMIISPEKTDGAQTVAQDPKGVKELKYIDPRQIRKVKDVRTRRDESGAEIPIASEEFFLYNQFGMIGPGLASGVKISADSIAYAHSGIIDESSSLVLSHLDKAIKPANNLKMMEDALVIYRLVRAPERRVFYIDVGNLPKPKAEEYIDSIIQKHKNKVVYDARTGQVKDDKKHLTMTEDYFLPRNGGARGTEVSALSGGANLGEITDVEYFQKKLFKALNVPISRLEPTAGFTLGRSSEITRDELKFDKFIKKLQLRFTMLFDEIFRVHLCLKGLIKRSEWPYLRTRLRYVFNTDSYFAELKEAEIWKERLDLLRDASEYEGKYFTKEWIQKTILRQSDEDIRALNMGVQQDVPEGGEGSSETIPSDEPFENREASVTEPVNGTQNSEIRGEPGDGIPGSAETPENQ